MNAEIHTRLSASFIESQSGMSEADVERIAQRHPCVANAHVGFLFLRFFWFWLEF